MSTLNKFIFTCKLVFIIIFNHRTFHYIELNTLSNKIAIKNEYSFPNVYSIYELFNYNNYNNTVLIFEPFGFHYECSPGFAKYFTDLGYNVDIIMQEIGLDSFFFFNPLNKIRFFIYRNLKDIEKYAEYLSNIFINYNYALVETVTPKRFKLYKKLKLLNIKYSFYVFHHLEYIFNISPKIHLNKNQIWTLGNFTYGIQINPHYFGNFKLKRKGDITRFFITSTIERNYKPLISALEKIKEENLKFEIIVVGKWNYFSEYNISKRIKKHVCFKYNITYLELYKELYNSDYIIINLDPESKKDDSFKKSRVSGSIQLSYGFLKPPIINKDFAKIYGFNSNNSFLYDNSNLEKVMIDAIYLNNYKYKKMQKKLKKAASRIYSISLENIKKCFDKN